MSEISDGYLQIREVKRLAADGIFCVVIIVLCLFLGLGRYLNGIGLGDEGFLAYGAVRVLEGQVPNRDFVSYQPPLSFYTIAIMFKLFGTSLVSMRIFGLCIYIIIPLSIYALSRCLSSRVIALATAVPATVLGLPYFDFVPFAVWQGVAATLLAALFIIQAGATGRRWWAFLAGLTTALTILLRHDQGFYLSVAILVYALALKFTKRDSTYQPHPGKMIGFWLVGLVSLLLPLGIYWLICGAIPHMFEQLVASILKIYVKTSSLPMPAISLDQPLKANVLTALVYLPIIVEILIAVWLLVCFARKRFHVKDAHAGFIVVLSMLFYCQVLTRSDVYHLLITLPPFFVLCAWLLEGGSKASGIIIGKWCGRDSVFRGGTVTVVAVMLLVAETAGIFCLLNAKTVLLSSPDEPTTKILLKRAGVYVEPVTAGMVEKIVGKIQMHASPDRSILCLPYHPMFYFLSGRRNPTRWNYLWPGDQNQDDYRTLVKQAQNDQPAIVVIFDKSEMQHYAPAVFDYLNAEYRVEQDLGWVTFYLPLADKNVNIY